MSVIYLLMEKIPDTFWEIPSIRCLLMLPRVSLIHCDAICLCCHTVPAVYSVAVVLLWHCILRALYWGRGNACEILKRLPVLAWITASMNSQNERCEVFVFSYEDQVTKSLHMRICLFNKTRILSKLVWSFIMFCRCTLEVHMLQPSVLSDFLSVWTHHQCFQEKHNSFSP